MDPITIGIQAVGLGLKIFGGQQAASDASQAADLSSSNARLEGQVVQQRQQAMELSAKRQNLEIFRNTQKAQSMGLAAATNQGAQFGSGYAGGYASTTNQGLFNSAGVNQNLQIGRNIFGIEGQESTNNAQISQLKGQQATSEGMASLGGSLLTSGATMGNVFGAGKGMFNNVGNLFMGGNSPTGL